MMAVHRLFRTAARSRFSQYEDYHPMFADCPVVYLSSPTATDEETDIYCRCHKAGDNVYQTAQLFIVYHSCIHGVVMLAYEVVDDQFVQPVPGTKPAVHRHVYEAPEQMLLQWSF